METTDEELIGLARYARDEDSYAWRSEFEVGAALLVDGNVYTGANIEVSGMSTSVHAEMLAFFNAIQHKGPETVSDASETIAVSCSDEGGYVPCMLCLHTMSEFTHDVQILTDEGDGYSEYSLADQYKDAYRPGDHD